jgi:nicotine oxidoreductase
MRGFSNYYSFVSNRGKLSSFLNFILKRSCAKLLATKFNLKTMAQTFKKFGPDLKSTDCKGIKLVKLPYNNTGEFKIDANPIIQNLYSTKSLANLYNLSCSLCGSDYRVEMHHIRMMKNLNPKLSKVDQIMVKANRKQIPLCRSCHMKKHSNSSL